jgi:hypothetical protein
MRKQNTKKGARARRHFLCPVARTEKKPLNPSLAREKKVLLLIYFFMNDSR